MLTIKDRFDGGRRIVVTSRKIPWITARTLFTCSEELDSAVPKDSSRKRRRKNFLNDQVGQSATIVYHPA